MCKFCYELGENNKEINWKVRSTYADDNFIDFNYIVKSEGFRINAHKYNDTVMVGLEYRFESKDGLIISPFSEMIQWSYCPFCGLKLGESEPKFADEMYEYQFSIEDSDYDEAVAIRDVLYSNIKEK